jgi:cell division protease FtsH
MLLYKQPLRIHTKCSALPYILPPPVIRVAHYIQPKLLSAPPLATLSYNEFMKDIKTGKIEKAIIADDNKMLVFDKEGNEMDVQVPDAKSTNLIEKLMLNDINVVYDGAEQKALFRQFSFLFQYMFMGLVGALSIQIIFSLMKQQNTSKSKIMEVKDIKVRFSDVAGLENAKIELQEVIDFLKFPEKYSIVGGKIPRGCLLIGPPGTGKTLLAKAIAGEAGVPFYSCSASEFIELFVGVGASRVRDLFKNAASSAPCIIFIDEIDAIGKARGSAHHSTNSNDEREQTINQLLTEMDGFKENNGVIVIAATNRADVLDSALLRPGRFDRQIMVDLPDVYDRNAILKVHTQNKPLDECVNLEDMARVTSGYSGADLANLANEAAILTARRNKIKIGMKEFEDAMEKIMLGFEKKPFLSEEKRRIVAYHEAGHVLVALNLHSNYDTIRKVTILPRGKTGGVTLFNPDPDMLESGLYSKDYLLNSILVALGGRVAEEIVFGKNNATTGAASDLERVQQVARLIVTIYGFNDEIGPVTWKLYDNPCSEMMLAKMDTEIENIVKFSYKRVYGIIKGNQDILENIAMALLEKETLTYDEIMDIYRD